MFAPTKGNICGHIPLSTNAIVIGQYSGNVESNTTVIGHDENHIIIKPNGTILVIQDGHIVNASLSTEQISGELLNDVLRKILKSIPIPFDPNI